MNRILRTNEVMNRSGYRRTTLHTRITEKLWTKPIKLGTHAVGWPEYEVDALIAARIASQSDEEIAQLVQKLETHRKTVIPHIEPHC